MKKYPIGFNTRINKEAEKETQLTVHSKPNEPRKSLVRVYFAKQGVSYSYYNDRFDLKVGDFVFVEGKMAGKRGQVTEVNHCFKIKLSDYMKVTAVVDTSLNGNLYLLGSHVVSFDKKVIPFSKIRTWFNAQDNDEEYVSCNDDANSFSLNCLSEMKISHDAAKRGHDYYVENRVSFIEVDGTEGHAVVEGGENYEIEFNYINGEISSIKCSCFCTGACKHEFAAMLQLRESLEFINENYPDEYNGYFAIISKGVLIDTVFNKETSGKISCMV